MAVPIFISIHWRTLCSKHETSTFPSPDKLPIVHTKALRVNELNYDHLSIAEWLFANRLSRKFAEISVLKLGYKWKETYHVMLSWEHDKTSKLSVCNFLLSSVQFCNLVISDSGLLLRFDRRDVSYVEWKKFKWTRLHSTLLRLYSLTMSWISD